MFHEYQLKDEDFSYRYQHVSKFHCDIGDRVKMPRGADFYEMEDRDIKALIDGKCICFDSSNLCAVFVRRKRKSSGKKVQ